MSPLLMVTAGLALTGATILVAGIVIILVAVQRRPYQAELAPTKGSPAQGVLYAFTLGMAPWAKESARRHWIAYLRGIIFHISIFVGGAISNCQPMAHRVPITAACLPGRLSCPRRCPYICRLRNAVERPRDEAPQYPG